MCELVAFNLTWTDLTKLYWYNTFSMVGSEEVLLHGEVCEEDLNGETCTWDAVAPMIDNQSNVVPLQEHAEINQWSSVLCNQDSSLSKEKAASYWGIVPCLSKHELEVYRRYYAADDNQEVNRKSNYSHEIGVLLLPCKEFFVNSVWWIWLSIMINQVVCHQCNCKTVRHQLVEWSQ